MGAEQFVEASQSFRPGSSISDKHEQRRQKSGGRFRKSTRSSEHCEQGTRVALCFSSEVTLTTFAFWYCAKKGGPVQHSWSSTKLISLDPNSVHRIYIPVQSKISLPFAHDEPSCCGSVYRVLPPNSTNLSELLPHSAALA